MPTSSTLRTLYQLGSNWDRGAEALRQLGGPVGLPADAARQAFEGAAASLMQARSELLLQPEDPVTQAILAATRLPPNTLVSLLEDLSATFMRLRNDPLRHDDLPRATLARIGEFMSDSGQALLHQVARQRAS